MKHLIPILLLFTISPFHPFTLSAAVPLRWTVETSRAQPATFEAYQGETLDFEATLQSYGKPLEAPVQYAFYWQTNGMGSAYWSAPCTVPGASSPRGADTNLLRATWLPTYDVGAKAYNCFIGLSNSIYHAAFQLRLRPSPGAVPNELPLPQKVIDFSQVTVLNPPWPTGSARQLPKYLHALDFADSYPDDAAWYYQQADMGGACSSVRDGNVYSRNFDFPFDERAEFVVRMSAGPGRFASVGVTNVGTNLTEDVVTSGRSSRFYKALPGATVDGINSEGVVCNINVCSTNGSPWETQGGRDLNAIGVVRWILDNATNAATAAAYVKDHCYIPESMKRKGYSAHFMIADRNETWIVEDGKAANANWYAEYYDITLTNFRVLMSDVYDPGVEYDPYGTGRERFVILKSGGNITSAWFKAAYATGWPRPTEFAAPDVGTNSDYDELRSWADAHVAPLLEPDGVPKRNTGLWQSVHTSVYDITNRILRIAVQETDDWYTFSCPPADPSVAIQNKRDLTDRTFVTYEPGDWSPSVVDGIWYSPQWYGDGWSVEKYRWYYEWGEWYWEDSEWIYGPGEDAMTLVAHKLWSDEEITLTRARVPVEDSLALESQIGSVAQSAAREYLNDNDLVKWKKLLRTGLPGQWGTGWGNVHWEFASDRRWWTMKVPDFTATVTAGGHVDSNGNDVVSSSITIDGRSYVTDPMRRITRTPVKILTQTEGTNGTERCATATWNSVLVPTGEQSAIDDPDACAYAIRFSIDFQDGLSDVSVLPRRLLAPVVYNDGAYYETLYTMSDFSAEVESATNSSATVKCRYACRARYRPSVSSYTPVTYTNWFTVAISNPSGAYTEITKEYGRVITSNTRNLFWDPSLHATWRIDVTNGCFFSEIVSTNNLTGVR